MTAVPYLEAISLISTYLSKQPSSLVDRDHDHDRNSHDHDTDQDRDIRLEYSIGETLDEDYRATVDAPPFDNSAMDGYALSSHHTTQASPSHPITFKVIGSIGAGDEPIVLGPTSSSGAGEAMDERTCFEIMTGAPFPLDVDVDAEVERGRWGRFDSCVRHESVVVHQGNPDEDGASSSSNPSRPTTYPTSASASASASTTTTTLTSTSFPRAKYITLHAPVTPRTNRKLAGEDFKIGQLLARAGERVTGGKVMVLASTGLDRVRVRPGGRRGRDGGQSGGGVNKGKRGLRIGVLTTGKEVAHNHNIGAGSTSHDPRPSHSSTTLNKGHIYNSNAPYLLATLRSWGHDPVLIPAPLEDTAAEFQDCLRRAATLGSGEGGEDENPELDLIITTGGVSAGRHDYVPGSVLELGGKVVFHKTFIRPGFPVLFGDIPRRGAGQRPSLPIFGLPGNPIAVAACLRFLVVEFLQGASGVEAGNEAGIKVARLLPSDFTSNSTPGPAAGCGVSRESRDSPRPRSHKKPIMTRCFVPARCHAKRPTESIAPSSDDPSTTASTTPPTIPGLDLIPWVELLTRSASLTRAMSEANCWIVLPEGKDVFEEGEVVEMVDMRP